MKHSELKVLANKVVRYGKKTPPTNMRLLLSEWGFHIFSSSLGAMIMGVAALFAIGICTDQMLDSKLVFQVLKAILDNPVAFAVVWVATYALILGYTALKTIQEQSSKYRYRASGSHKRKKPVKYI